MLLSNQLFDRIVGLSAPAVSDPQRKGTVLPAGCRRVTERRTAARLPYGHRSQICRDSGKQAGVWETVMLQDISVKGMGCLCHDPMEIGDTFVLKIADQDGESIRIRCKVQHCERGGFGNTAYLVGSTFEQVIQQQAIRLNDDEIDAPVGHEEIHAQPQAVVMANESGGLKTAMTKAAVSLFKAVDPSRMFARKADDFSSAS